MIPQFPAREEAYERASFPIEDAVLEAECRRRGTRMAFLTMAAIFGYDSLKLVKELHSIMTEPMQDAAGNKRDLDEELFLRMTFWSVEAETNVDLYSPTEQAYIERSMMVVLGDYQPLTQERFEEWKDAVLKMKFEDKATGQALMN